jgi:alkylated DNA repair dioxygenase AlkB
MDLIYLKKEDNQEYSLIGVINDIFTNENKNQIFSYLNSLKTFKGGTTNFGEIPREQAWYQEENKYFSKTWKDQDIDRWKSNDYGQELIKLQHLIQDQVDELDIYQYNGLYKPKINSCLINKYRDGRDSIRPHRDNQTTFGDNPTVIGLSIGEERNIVFKRIIYNPDKMNSIKEDKINKEEISIPLKSGSIFIMAGAIQKYFSHEIPKVENKGLRYSLTFREYI